MKRRLSLLVIGSLAVCLTGCNAPKVSDADIRQITLERYDALRGDDSVKTVLIDVRPRAHYARGHIPGSLNIPLPDLANADPRLAEAANIVVYAGGWMDYLSPAAAKRLVALSYQNVYDMRGGIEEWESIGRRLESDQPAEP